MHKSERSAVLAAYYGSRERYDRLAREIERLFDDGIDPAVPASAIYTIKHRHKDESRLIEKLDEAAQKHSVTPENYADYVSDLVGVRVVCLLLSDVDRVEAFIQSLAEEKRLKLIEGPEHKKTFILQVDPRSELPSDLDLQYTGYSSIHYVVSRAIRLRPSRPSRASGQSFRSERCSKKPGERLITSTGTNTLVAGRTSRRPLSAASTVSLLTFRQLLSRRSTSASRRAT
jgi:hypothetical protein